MTGDRDVRPLARPAAVLLAAALLLTLLPAGATAGTKPATRKYGPLIEGYAPYVGQSTCSPTAKPGVRRFADILLKTYGQTWIGIGRACNIGGKSEHKEGRALDWSLDATKRADRRKARNLLRWLFATDAYGNAHAMAKRLGIMYVIWNRRWWTSWDRGWSTYCVQRKRGCKSPRDGSFVHPHDDHVHFSFSWPAARKQTTFFTPAASFAADMATDPDQSGYRVAGGNGSVYAFGASHHGSRSGSSVRPPAVGIEPTPTGKGYWLLLKNGRVMRFGDAALHGRVRRATVAGMAATPSGDGYWVVGRSGRVWAFGDATHYGSVSDGGSPAVGIGARPTGDGYWVFTKIGAVHAFGGAPHRGDVADKRTTIVSGTPRGARGYLLVNGRGRVFAFGTATLHGQGTQVEGLSPVARILGSPDGKGYWILGRRGKVAAFGSATPLGSIG